MGSGTACALSDQCINDGRTFLRFTNTNAAARTVTINHAVPCGHGTTHSISVTVPANTGDVLVGPFPTAWFNNSAGYVVWTIDVITDATVWAFQLSDSGV
jgi:hypothetical protein